MLFQRQINEIVITTGNNVHRLTINSEGNHSSDVINALARAAADVWESNAAGSCCGSPNPKPQGGGWWWCMSCGARWQE